MMVDGGVSNAKSNHYFVCWLCVLGNTMIPALQEAAVNVSVGHAGMQSGSWLALGARFLNISISKRDKESATSLLMPGIWVTHMLML